MKNFSNQKGQELVEFALILPVMVVILVAISEMGFMWTLRGTVSDAVKSAVQQMQTIAGTDVATAETTLQTNIRNYLTNHGVPNANSVTVNLSDPTASNYTTVNVRYTYNPTFTLPNFFGIQILPDSLTMGSSQVINSAILRQNNYASGDPSLPSLIDPNSPTSVLIDDPTGEQRKQMAFIIDLPGNVDKVVNWWGHDLLPAGAGISAVDGVMMVKTPYTTDRYANALAAPDANGWVKTNESYAGLLLANGYTTVVYTDGSAGSNIDNVQLPGPVNIYDGEIGALNWCTPASAGGTNCDGDLTTNSANTSLLVSAVNEIGKGYEVLPPTPNASAVDPVTLPSGDLASDKTYRELLYKDQNFAKLKFYYPKSLGAAYAPPNAGTISLATDADRRKILEQTVDADGDGIPSYWDLAPNDADDDKNLVLDGYQAPAGFNAAPTAYPVYDWGPIDTMTGNVPTANVTTPTVAAIKTNLAAATRTYLNPADAAYSNSTCANAVAQASCGNQPYFLRVFNMYSTTNGKPIRGTKIKADCTTAACNAEKYREPDANKGIFIVEVVSRDHDQDGTIEMSTGTASPTDDDGNDDNVNNGSDDDTAILSDGVNFTRGLIFIDNTTGANAFVDVADPLSLGYDPVDPNNLGVTTSFIQDPARKATTVP